MAWEDYERRGFRGITGDIPIDAMAVAVKLIASSYRNQFGRKPYVDELLFALETVIGSEPGAYVADPEGLALADIIVLREK